MNRGTRRTRRVAGFTLVEVLVALVVLSIGLIGLAGLQNVSLSQNYNAYLRSQATALAYELADRVRANRDGADAGNYDEPSSGTEHGGCSSASGCSAQQMAETDMANWIARVATELPLGTGVVCQDSTPTLPPTAFACDGTGPTHVIRVVWDDDRDGVAEADNPAESLVFAFVP